MTPLDIRTPGKLVDGIHGDISGRHSWLSPFDCNASDSLATVYIVFDEPVMLACIRLWNYSRTPQRGAREVTVLLDDLAIFVGTMRSASKETDSHQSVLFSNEELIIQRERCHVYLDTMEADAELLLYNETKEETEGISMMKKNHPTVRQQIRPSTSIMA